MSMSIKKRFMMTLATVLYKTHLYVAKYDKVPYFKHTSFKYRTIRSIKSKLLKAMHYLIDHSN